ncbi:hypothetical protein FSARC_8096 [Fusarium sarcochroum]|uniref:Ankyrin repeat protein n=1 Tax=Fusarium sarcochroum TaxID=1208366 RepID=A0A8H4X7L8_9HYPO|nr:hypothetical protein FSARC_8096 [Fusarium sarcochroum]
MYDAANGGDIILLQDLFAQWDLLASQTPKSKLAKSGRHRKSTFGRVLRGAVESGDLNIVVYLLDVRGVEIHQIPVTIAVNRNHWNILRAFIDHGWDINKPTAPGDFPILGYYVDNVETARGLLEAGANPNLARADDEDISIPNEAAMNGTVEVLKLMREYGVDFNKTDALNFAAGDDERAGNRIPVMAYLIDEVGLSINRLDYANAEEAAGVHERWQNGTALHHAVLGKATENLEYLLARGADRNVKNLRGETPLDLARKNEWDEGIRLLESWPQYTLHLPELILE